MTATEFEASQTFHRSYLAPESEVLDRCLSHLDRYRAARPRITAEASALIEDVRRGTTRPPLIDQFLQEYGLSTEEGVILMRLAEAVLRVPDDNTVHMLLRDRIGDGDWQSHLGQAGSSLINLSTRGLQFAKNWIDFSGGPDSRSLITRMGDRVFALAVGRAMAIMGEHFVLGRDIAEAIDRSSKFMDRGFSFSYDMLGEAALTAEDAERYFDSYLGALQALIGFAKRDESGYRAGLSVKLSALYPRYERAQADRCVPALEQKLRILIGMAREHDLNLAIDAEEADRLETSLMIIERLMSSPDLAGWDGLSVVVQAYSRRALDIIDWLADQAERNDRRIAVRLVKGAYWDSEIKRAQQFGLSSYPVFTRKENTDVSYLACAQRLLDHHHRIYPQFATHNAHTAIAIKEMAPSPDVFEFQCLYGMGEALHTALVERFGARSRIYAPVGKHADLLPYLVRRLLENGANSSFVNQLFDPDVAVSQLVNDPVGAVEVYSSAANDRIPAPRDQFNGGRLIARGIDLTQTVTLASVEASVSESRQLGPIVTAAASDGVKPWEIRNPADRSDLVGTIAPMQPADVAAAVASTKSSAWHDQPASARAAILRTVADQLEEQMEALIPLIVREAGKLLTDAVDEVREAVDFCRYYANQAEKLGARPPLGTLVCISPWNFPLAIFCGQVAAGLAAGNCVLAKPAEQTPLIAQRCVAMFHECGVPADALILCVGSGDIGAALVADTGVDGVCFTGSTGTAKRIAASLAETGRPLVPLIAETGGQNAMIIDSTALLEQAVTDLVSSAFQSAGQRCSACRVVCVQEDIADEFAEMLAGAMAELRVDDPALGLTDVGPVIDDDAATMLTDYIKQLEKSARRIATAPMPDSPRSDRYIAPVAFELDSLAALGEERFGPVLHLVRFHGQKLRELIDDINAMGYGLTLGLHTRIDSRIDFVADRAHVGNIYVNRNQIGAIVGVQPFGGHGLSGTGPKAGGPHYLLRLTLADGHEEMAIHDEDLPEPSSGNKADSAVTKMREASRWRALDRAEVLLGAAESLGKDDPVSPLLERAGRLAWRVFQQVHHLPGPTGETNTLYLTARGVLACLGGDDPDAVIEQALIALAAGSAVQAFAKGEQAATLRRIDAALQERGAPSQLIRIFDPVAPDALALIGVDAVVCDGADRAAVATHLSHQDGPIVALLSRHDDPERFCVEKTVTVNTTAAGGNASLLAL